MSFNIAIDGPAGAGKSTIAKQLAKKTSFIYVDTGAMYRAMAYYFLQQGIAENETDKIKNACRHADVSITYKDGEQKVMLNGEDVTPFIRSEAVGNMASISSPVPEVRAKLTQLQKDLAARENVVMDGRDIGTCVLPDAQVKVYLTASTHTRALRRYNELLEKGQTDVDMLKIETDIEERDYRDMHREISPLRQAEDAVLVDSSDMSVEEVVKTILELVKNAEKI